MPTGNSAGSSLSGRAEAKEAESGEVREEPGLEELQEAAEPWPGGKLLQVRKSGPLHVRMPTAQEGEDPGAAEELAALQSMWRRRR